MGGEFDDFRKAQLIGDFKPVEGRSVVYQIAEGEWRPAQIVQVFGSINSANLVVFLDGDNDKRYGFDGSLTFWATSRKLGTEVGEFLPRKP